MGETWNDELIRKAWGVKPLLPETDSHRIDHGQATNRR